jgi:hypothetical protein
LKIQEAAKIAKPAVKKCSSGSLSHRRTVDEYAGDGVMSLPDDGSCEGMTGHFATDSAPMRNHT